MVESNIKLEDGIVEIQVSSDSDNFSKIELVGLMYSYRLYLKDDFGINDEDIDKIMHSFMVVN